MTTRSLTPREGRPLPSGGPYEGIPSHLRGALEHWFEELFTGRHSHYTDQITYDNGHMLALAAAARIDLSDSPRDLNLLRQILAEARSRDDEDLLDLVHAALQVTQPPDEIGVVGMRRPPAEPPAVDALRQLLTNGGSVWTATQTGLQRRVAPPVETAFDKVLSPQDVASGELAEAWSKAYGRHPNAADAWDHSIKAVEAVLRPVVCPTDTNATLGRIIGILTSQGQTWKLILRGRNRDHNIEPLVHMLNLLWPDPNRHGSPTPEPPATLQEAQAVVQLAVTIVQWGRDGLIVKK